MEEMTWPEIRAAIADGYDTVVVGIGSTEQHGPHLPTMTDTRIGDDVAHRVARRLGNALQARTVPFGMSEHHLAFGGTVSLRPATLKAVLEDTVDSLARCGFRRIVLLPSHGGNFATVQAVIDEAHAERPGVVVTGYADLLGFSGFLERESARFGVSAEACGAHAGENETPPRPGAGRADLRPRHDRPHPQRRPGRPRRRHRGAGRGLPGGPRRLPRRYGRREPDAGHRPRVGPALAPPTAGGRRCDAVAENLSCGEIASRDSLATLTRAG